MITESQHSSLVNYPGACHSAQQRESHVPHQTIAFTQGFLRSLFALWELCINIITRRRTPNWGSMGKTQANGLASSTVVMIAQDVAYAQASKSRFKTTHCCVSRDNCLIRPHARTFTNMIGSHSPNSEQRVLVEGGTAHQSCSLMDILSDCSRPSDQNLYIHLSVYPSDI